MRALNASDELPVQAHVRVGPTEEAFLAALAGLPHLTPSRLRQLLSGREPAETWARVRAGVVLGESAGEGRSRSNEYSSASAPPGGGSAGPIEADGPDEPGLPPEAIQALGGRRKTRWTPEALARVWRAHAERTDPEQVWTAYQAAGVRICRQGSAEYPGALCDDPEAPPVLFWLGALSDPAQPTVALVGTRACTHYGEDVAADLGSGLARAGVSVVSGLALGIDGAAHRGALAGGGAPPLGIVGSGLDVVYPPRHARLWRQIATLGGLLSEAPLGAAAEAWRFPWRNRLIAALSDVVVVVESHRAGGALLTVEAAMRRGVAVMAVPGSVRSAASAGTNSLIADGCAPVRDVEDVLVALGLSISRNQMHLDGYPRPGEPPSPGCPGTPEAAVWSALDAEPTPTDVILRRTGLTLGEMAAALHRLEEGGWANPGDGWWERAGAGPVGLGRSPALGLGRSPGRVLGVARGGSWAVAQGGCQQAPQ